MEEHLIPYDRMKEQIERDITSIPGTDLPMPEITFEKGSTRIMFPIPAMSERLIFDILAILKKQIENIRIASFGDGHYSFQALNRNLFKADNILDNLKVDIFSVIGSRIEISRKGNLSQEELNAVTAIYHRVHAPSSDDPAQRLRALGATLYQDSGILSWDSVAGYEDVKKQIRESIILPLKNPDVYDGIARMTRRVAESNRPRAILFEGSPGVGKTTVARIIAGDVDIPLVYVPVESIMSKWYGVSSQNMAGIFDACEEMGGAIIFLDEIDSLVGSRDQNMFEATRRILSVLLRKLDGMDSAVRTLTIGATNRTGDLDHALLSRFDVTITFPLPDPSERAAIFATYARHLPPEELSILGERSEGLSGRTIKDICESAERRWARKILLQNQPVSPPPGEYYRHAIRLRIAGK